MQLTEDNDPFLALMRLINLCLSRAIELDEVSEVDWWDISTVARISLANATPLCTADLLEEKPSSF